MNFKKECEFYWFGQKWRCLRVPEVPGDPSSLGGLLDPEKKTIYINDGYDEESFLDYLHHELTEGALLLSACCYSRTFPDEKDVFVMDHTQMDLMSSTVRGAYETVKTNMGIKQASAKSPRRKVSKESD